MRLFFLMICSCLYMFNYFSDKSWLLMNNIGSRNGEQQIVLDLLENVINVSERMENVLDEG